MDAKDTTLLKDILSACRQTDIVWKDLQVKYPHLRPLLWYTKDSCVHHAMEYLVLKYSPKVLQESMDKWFSTRDLTGLYVSMMATVKQLEQPNQTCRIL